MGQLGAETHPTPAQGSWVKQRLLWVILGYIAASVIAASALPMLMLTVETVASLLNGSKPHGASVIIDVLFGIVAIGIVFAIPLTIIQFTFSVVYAEKQRITDKEYYLAVGALTGMSAWILMPGPTYESASWAAFFAAPIGAISGYIYWRIAVRRVRANSVETNYVNILKSALMYIVALYAAFMVYMIPSELYAEFTGNAVAGASSLAARLAFACILVLQSTLVASLYTGAQFSLARYILEKRGIRTAKHYIAAGIIIALSIYVVSPSIWRPSAEIGAMQFAYESLIEAARFVSSGTIGGYLYWLLSVGRWK